MLALIVFLITLSVLVFIHEIGHFLMAKKFGVKVEEFGLGYPPRIWGKKIGDTIYSINWLPFGGFVRLFGEDYLDEGKTNSHLALFNKTKSVRALVAVAGVVGNFLLGIICFSLVYSFMGIPQKVDYVKVDAVAPGSPADSAGIKPGMVVAAVDGEPITDTSQFMEAIQDKKGQEVDLSLKDSPKSSQLNVVEVVPRIDPPAGEGAVGVAISSIDFVFYPSWQMPFRGAVYGVEEAVGWGIKIIEGLAATLKGFAGGSAPEVAGPVGIYQITANVVNQGWLLTLQFVGILSINLAILNLLPFPALDGGRLAFIGLEALIGQRIKPKVEQYIHMAGMALLVTLMILVTFNDLNRLFGTGQFVGNLLRSIGIQ